MSYGSCDSSFSSNFYSLLANPETPKKHRFAFVSGLSVYDGENEKWENGDEIVLFPDYAIALPKNLFVFHFETPDTETRERVSIFNNSLFQGFNHFSMKNFINFFDQQQS